MYGDHREDKNWENPAEEGRSQEESWGWQEADGQYRWSRQDSVKEENMGDREYNRMDRSYIPSEPVKMPGKKSSMAAKAAGITAAALLFGTVAGGTMFGVNTAGEFLRDKYAPKEETRVTLETAKAPEAKESAITASTALMTDVSSIVKSAMPSVVAITNTMILEQRSWFGPSQRYEVPSSGSGIIVGQNDNELLIVTNNHVVEDSKELSVTFINDTTVSAAIKGTDSESDLAIIAIPLSEIDSETMGEIKVATMGDSDALEVGQGVIAIGNALGYGQSVTVGYVSALNREVKSQDSTSRNLLQTDAAINPGNSGGALLNMRGEVIGINAAKYSSTEVEGMGYAIPISKAKDIIDDLMNRKTRMELDVNKQGYLGIQAVNIDDTTVAMYGMPKGVYVYKIMEGGAAANSGLREKDIITKFDGQTIRSKTDLQEMLTYYEGGSVVTLTVYSLENGEYVERTVEVTLDYKTEAESN
ncbi:trypsin-like peptidase domain-containing protein [Candidatus Ventrimonas sp. KK005]|nr:PDZ domain-containing protein [Lachnospiraceae bacterium]NBH19032.1 PDZ domain-containing protein [Clostridiaceae bacterium]